MKPVVKCPECGWPNRHDYTVNVPESLRCGYCGADVFLEARMRRVDAALRWQSEARRKMAQRPTMAATEAERRVNEVIRKMMEQSQDRDFLEHWHE